MRKTLGENIAWAMLLIVMLLGSAAVIYSVEHGTSIQGLASNPAELALKDHRVAGIVGSPVRKFSYEKNDASFYITQPYKLQAGSTEYSGTIWELKDKQGNTIDMFIYDGSSFPIKTGDEVEVLGYWTEKDGDYLLFVKNLGVLAQ